MNEKVKEAIFWVWFLAIEKVFFSIVIGLFVASAMSDLVNSKKVFLK